MIDALDVGARARDGWPAETQTAPSDRRIPGHVRVVGTSAELAVVQRRGINLALWPRILPANVIADLTEAVSTGLAPIRFEACRSEIGTELQRRLRDVLPEWLAHDAAQLARILAQVANARRIALRIEAFTGDACRLFHADAVAMRLVTSYHGRGTQWLADADADVFQGDRAIPDDRVHEVATGTVAIFKGSRDTTGGHPLVHRSPPRQPGDAVRLFLAIDPVVS